MSGGDRERFRLKNPAALRGPDVGNTLVAISITVAPLSPVFTPVFTPIFMAVFATFLSPFATFLVAGVLKFAKFVTNPIATDLLDIGIDG
jgi:hypothetical protein